MKKLCYRLISTYRIISICILVLFLISTFGAVRVSAADMRSETQRLLIEYLHKFDKHAFMGSSGVSLGDEATYLSALNSVDIEYDSNLKAQAEYRPPIVVLGKVVSKGKIVFSEDIASGVTSPTLAGTIWHEVTHVIEGLNGDDDSEKANDTLYQERHIEYMEQASRALDKLVLLEIAANRGDDLTQLKNRYDAFLAELAKTQKQPGPAAYPPEEARMLGWFGFKVVPKEILKHYAKGTSGEALKGLANAYGVTSDDNLDLGKYTWEGEWNSNWGHMILTQSGSTVTGTYTHDSGRITAVVYGNKLIGTWSEAPSYAPDKDAGNIEFIMSEDGKTFGGAWGYGSNLAGGSWTGSKRLTPVAPAPDPNAPENQKKIILQINHSNISVKGKLVPIDSPPTIVNNRTMMPIRAVAEAMGGTVGWDDAQRKITITVKNTTIEMWVDKTTILVNGQSKTIDVAPTIINNRTMVPVRFVADNIPGCAISWDAENQSAVITYVE